MRLRTSVREVIDHHSNGAGADDVIVTVPVASVMASAARLMNDNGMLVFFAGVANGTTGPLDMSRVYLSNAQYTGTSGSTIEDQALVLDKTAQGSLSPDLNLAAVGGIEAGRDGVQAMLDGRFAGKIVIFPKLPTCRCSASTSWLSSIPKSEAPWAHEDNGLLKRNDGSLRLMASSSIRDHDADAESLLRPDDARRSTAPR